jgi:hypothetical protein
MTTAEGGCYINKPNRDGSATLDTGQGRRKGKNRKSESSIVHSEWEGNREDGHGRTGKRIDDYRSSPSRGQAID